MRLIAAFCMPIASAIGNAASENLPGWVGVKSMALANTAASNRSTAGSRFAPAAIATSEPASTPSTNSKITAPACAAAVHCPWPSATDICVLLPLMNETNKFPSCRKPTASTQPATAIKATAKGNGASIG